jgi:hypothetical protein
MLRKTTTTKIMTYIMLSISTFLTFQVTYVNAQTQEEIIYYLLKAFKFYFIFNSSNTDNGSKLRG